MEAWYTQLGAGTSARRRMLHILAAIESLAEHPIRHPRDRGGRREFSVEGHRVVYRLSSDAARGADVGDVLVIRVFGPGQSRF